MDHGKYSYRIQVEKAFHFLEARIIEPPEIVIILGSGLGAIAERIESALVLSYEEIPFFPRSTVSGHAGNLVFGRLSGRSVVALQGRFHFYEGYSTKEITLPLRVMSLLGAGFLVVSNAAGGLNRNFTTGSLMIIRDHVNFIPDNPLRGPNIDEWGLRFPDLSNAYDKELIETANSVVKNLGMTNVYSGVYGAIPGPSLETPAETIFLRNSGIDAIGMSTVPEVIVARHASMRVLGISVIANVNDPEKFQPISFEDVIVSTEGAAAQLTRLISEVIAAI